LPSSLKVLAPRALVKWILPPAIWLVMIVPFEAIQHLVSGIMQ
jgi:hypothetical protein